ncbi:MAG: alpha/beta fold hydrolase [Flavobacteriales bacterium]|nr:alpha/beta fold hydrolase [Flavobacteriales bacterium]
MSKSILLFLLLLSGLSCQAQSSHIVRSGDVDIHYETFGEGPPVLIINGGPGFNSQGFSSMAEKIQAMGYQPILFDQRGTGLSPVTERNASTISMDLMVQDMEAIRQDLELDEWTVLGHSFGGILANYYASIHPEVFTAMIQSASGGIDLSLLQTAQRDITRHFTPSEMDSLNRWRRQFREGDDLGARRKYNQLFAKAYVYDEKFIPQVADRLMEGDLDLNRMVWSDLRSIPYDCKPTLQSFCRPVLVIQGIQDIIPQALAYKADSVYCNSRIVFLDQCGHYGWLDQEEQYFQSIETFLDQVHAPPCSISEVHPERFGEGLLEGDVFRGSFSPGDSIFYFFKKLDPVKEEYGIFTSERTAEGWSTPERLILGNPHSDLYPSLSRDGQRMVFTSYRPLPDSMAQEEKPQAYLWYVDKQDGTWGEPVFMHQANTLGHYHSWAEFGWYDRIYFRRTTPDWRSRSTLFVRWEDGNYSRPEAFKEVDVWIDQMDSVQVVGGSPGPSRDLIFLDVATRDPETGRRGSDIWVSQKVDGEWQVPRVLEGGLKTDGYDVFPFYSSDGYSLYFNRDFDVLYSIPLRCVYE